jgi:outer membrane protein assembly factor BamB
MTRRASRLVLVALSLCCVLLISIGAALVWPKPVTAATSLMVLGEPYASQDITVRGSGFQAGENVLVTLDGVQIGSTAARQEMSVRNSTAGYAVLTVQLPDILPGGNHVLQETGQTTGRISTATITVPDDWPQKGRLPSATQFNGSETTISQSNVSQLTPLWTYGSPPFSYWGTPSISNGRLYIASDINTLDVFDETTGHHFFHGSGQYFGTFQPAIVRNVLYVGGYDIRAYDPSNETFLWTAEAADNYTIFTDGQTVAKNNMYAVGHEALYFFPAKATCDYECFSTSKIQADSGAFQGTPAVAHGIVYVSAFDNVSSVGSIQAMDALTGGHLWKGVGTSYSYASPLVDNGYLIVPGFDKYASASRLEIFPAAGCGAATCAPLWSATHSIYGGSPVAAAYGTVFLGGGDWTLTAFNESGCGNAVCDPVWTGSLNGYVVSAPTVANGVVYVNSSAGTTYAFNAHGCGAATCLPLWTFQAPRSDETFKTSPIIADGKLFVATNNAIYVFHLPSGAVTKPRPSSTPTIHTPKPVKH